MRVTYALTITARCPTDDTRPDIYLAEITAGEMVLVEEILEVVAGLTGEPIFQEQLTQALADELGCEVTTQGDHYGVATTCTAEPK